MSRAVRARVRAARVRSARALAASSSAHRSTAWADGAGGRREQRVDRGGKLGGEHPPGVAVVEVGGLMGQHDPALGRVEGTQQAGGDHDAAAPMGGGEGVGAVGVDDDQRVSVGQVPAAAAARRTPRGSAGRPVQLACAASSGSSNVPRWRRSRESDRSLTQGGGGPRAQRGDLGQLADPGEGHHGEHEQRRGADGEAADDQHAGGQRRGQPAAEGWGGGGEQHRHRHGHQHGDAHRCSPRSPACSVLRSRSASRRSSSAERVPTKRVSTAARSSRASSRRRICRAVISSSSSTAW